VGVVFLTNSMVVRKPRRFIQLYFGFEKPQPLRTVLDQLNAKAQIFTGFLCLLIGFSLQIGAMVGPEPGAAAGAGLEVMARLQALAILGLGIIGLTILLRVGQNGWSYATMRRMLAEFFKEHRDWNFEKHPAQTREIGELLGVAPASDDSIGDYSDRVRSALKLTPRGSTPLHGLRPDDAFAPLRNVGSERRS
jgi:hypothetical protein